MRLATNRWSAAPQPGPPKRTPGRPANRDKTPGADRADRPEPTEEVDGDDVVNEWTYSPVRTPPPQRRTLPRGSWATPHHF